MIDQHLPPGATPLNPEDARQLIPVGVSTRGQLDEFESANIQAAMPWARRTRDTQEILSVDFCQALHRQMFGKTWKWAGSFRGHDVSIGDTPYYKVPILVRELCEDARTWVQAKSYTDQELCIRFHHRLVWIHPFPNGNGRHSRIMADVLAKSLGLPRFRWGEALLSLPGKGRTEYIDALRAADRHDIGPLLRFSLS